MTPVRVLSANIQSGRAADGGQTTAAELAAAFEHLEADVVALQEVDRYQSRSGMMDQVSIIAEALGMPHHRFAAALAGQMRGAREVADPVGNHPGPAYGVALASRYPVIAWFATRLPQWVRRLPTLQGFRPGWWVHEPRVGLAAVLAGPDGPFVAASTHLSLLPPVSRHQLRALLAKVTALTGVRTIDDGVQLPGADSRPGGQGPAGAAGVPERLIVAGDFNLPESTVAKDTAQWHRPQALTFHADLPLRQIDHILVRGGTTTGTEAHRLTISDHRALATQVHWT